MDFARPNTHDCRTGRSHLIKGMSWPTLPAKFCCCSHQGAWVGGWGDPSPTALVQQCGQRREEGELGLGLEEKAAERAQLWGCSSLPIPPVLHCICRPDRQQPEGEPCPSAVWGFLVLCHLNKSSQSRFPPTAMSVCPVIPSRWHTSPRAAAPPNLLFLCPFQESIVGNCMDRSSPGQAMQVPDHNGLGYPARPSSSEHPRPRSLQRHHTIQNSDDAYVGGGGLCLAERSSLPSHAWVMSGTSRGRQCLGLQARRSRGDTSGWPFA